jgi:hypothetical protein
MHFLRIDLKLCLPSLIVKLQVQLHRTIVFDTLLSLIVLKLIGKDSHHTVGVYYAHLEIVFAHLHSLSGCSQEFECKLGRDQAEEAASIQTHRIATYLP